MYSIYTTKPYLWVGGNEYRAMDAFLFIPAMSQVIHTDFFALPLF